MQRLCSGCDSHGAEGLLLVICCQAVSDTAVSSSLTQGTGRRTHTPAHRHSASASLSRWHTHTYTHLLQLLLANTDSCRAVRGCIGWLVCECVCCHEPSTATRTQEVEVGGLWRECNCSPKRQHITGGVSLAGHCMLNLLLLAMVVMVERATGSRTVAGVVCGFGVSAHRQRYLARPAHPKRRTLTPRNTCNSLHTSRHSVTNKRNLICQSHLSRAHATTPEDAQAAAPLHAPRQVFPFSPQPGRRTGVAGGLCW